MKSKTVVKEHCPVCKRKLYYRATVMKDVCTNDKCSEYWTGENKPRLMC